MADDTRIIARQRFINAMYFRTSALIIKGSFPLASAHMMNVFFSIIFLFALIRLSWSIPQSHSSCSKVRVIRNPSDVLNGLAEYARALRKYDKIITSHPLHSRANLGDVDASLSSDQSGYTSPIVVGERDTAKTFLINLDTGSVDFWLFSNLLDNKTVLESHRVYEPLDSHTAVATGQTWNVTYGAGSAEGIVFNDTLIIGGFTIKNQSVEAAVQVDPIQFSSPDFTFDGMLGLAPLASVDTITPRPASSFLQNLFSNVEHPQKPIFTALLTRPAEQEGFFTFGSIDDELIGNKTITYTPVIKSSSFWQVPSRFISVNGKRIELPENEAIIDTGTTFILLSDNLIPIIYEPLGGIFNTTLQAWVFPTNFTDSQLPTIVLPIDNHTVTLAKNDIIFQQLDENWNLGSIQPSGDITGNASTYIYGDLWLRNVYAIFDLADGQNFRFGFVPRD